MNDLEFKSEITRPTKIKKSKKKIKKKKKAIKRQNYIIQEKHKNNFKLFKDNLEYSNFFEFIRHRLIISKDKYIQKILCVFLFNNCVIIDINTGI